MENNKINDLKVKELVTAIELAKTYNKFVNNFAGALIEARIKKIMKVIDYCVKKYKNLSWMQMQEEDIGWIVMYSLKH